MDVQSLGLLENYKELGVSIIEFALDDYVSTIKSLRTYYRKLDKGLEEGFKAHKYHQRVGDVLNEIYHRIRNLNDIESFLTGDWVKKLTDMDVEMLFRETKKQLRKKGYKVGLMGLTVKSDDKGVKIYAKEKESSYGKYMTYSLGISSKNQSGEWVNGFINCKFKKGVTVANKSKIKINSAFFVATKSGDKSYTHLMITDFDVLEAGETAGESVDEFMKIPEGIDEETPFL